MTKYINYQSDESEIESIISNEYSIESADHNHEMNFASSSLVTSDSANDDTYVKTIRRKYESLDKIEMNFMLNQYDNQTKGYIEKIRCQLYSLFESNKIVLLDPEFIRLILQKLNEFDSEKEKQAALNRMIAAGMLNHRNSRKTIEKSKQTESEKPNFSEKGKQLCELMKEKTLLKKTKLKCSLDTWEYNAHRDALLSLDMGTFYQEAKHYILSGSLEYHITSENTEIFRSFPSSFSLPMLGNRDKETNYSNMMKKTLSNEKSIKQEKVKLPNLNIDENKKGRNPDDFQSYTSGKSSQNILQNPKNTSSTKPTLSTAN